MQNSFITMIYSMCWHPVAQLVEAMRYKSEDRGSDSRSCHSSDTIKNDPGSTKHLTEMSNRNIFWGGGKRRPMRGTDFTSFTIRMSGNLRASATW